MLYHSFKNGAAPLGMIDDGKIVMNKSLSISYVT
jgi:hypothetical protein